MMMRKADFPNRFWAKVSLNVHIHTSLQLQPRREKAADAFSTVVVTGASGSSITQMP